MISHSPKDICLQCLGDLGREVDRKFTWYIYSRRNDARLNKLISSKQNAVLFVFLHGINDYYAVEYRIPVLVQSVIISEICDLDFVPLPKAKHRTEENKHFRRAINKADNIIWSLAKCCMVYSLKTLPIMVTSIKGTKAWPQ